MKLNAVISSTGRNFDFPCEAVAFVVDDEIDDHASGNAVAVVFCSPAGNVVHWYRQGYKAEEVFEAIGREATFAKQFKEYDVTVRKT